MNKNPHSSINVKRTCKRRGLKMSQVRVERIPTSGKYNLTISKEDYVENKNILDVGSCVRKFIHNVFIVLCIYYFIKAIIN
jgi:hypothetical protein